MIERIVSLMEGRGLNGVQLAHEAALPKNAVSEWKSGKSKPGTDAVVKIAKYFGVTADWLLTGEGPQMRHINEMEVLSVKEYTFTFIVQAKEAPIIFNNVTSVQYWGNKEGNIDNDNIKKHEYNLNCAYRFFSSDTCIGVFDPSNAGIISIQIKEMLSLEDYFKDSFNKILSRDKNKNGFDEAANE